MPRKTISKPKAPGRPDSNALYEAFVETATREREQLLGHIAGVFALQPLVEQMTADDWLYRFREGGYFELSHARAMLGDIGQEFIGEVCGPQGAGARIPKGFFELIDSLVRWCNLSLANIDPTPLTDLSRSFTNCNPIPVFGEPPARFPRGMRRPRPEKKDLETLLFRAGDTLTRMVDLQRLKENTSVGPGPELWSSSQAARPATGAADVSLTPTAGDNRTAILWALLKAYPSRLTVERIMTLLGDGFLSDKTIKAELKKLIGLGLAERFEGRKKGICLTPTGKEATEKLLATPVGKELAEKLQKALEERAAKAKT